MLRSFLSRYAHRLQYPTALLVALLQRTPVLRVAAQAETMLIDSPVGSVVRSAFAAAASLGVVHAMAGATQFVVSPNPANGSVGTSLSVGFTVTGAQSAPGSFRIVSGTLPPGLALLGATSAGYVNGTSAVISGTPTTAGTYSVLVRSWEFANGTGDSFPATAGYQITFNITGGTSSAPSFTTQPQSLMVNAGGFGTFVAAASGSPAPTYAWRKNGVAISGATNASLTLSGVSAADAGTYSVVATNTGGSATSSSATLTVNPLLGSPSSQGHIVNMSVLTNVDAGETVTFGYFLGGSGTSGTTPILMRGMGPTLGAAPFSLSGTLSDPTLAFYAGSTQIAANNDWSGDPALSAAVTAVQAFPFASATSKDAAIFAQNVDLSGGHSIKLSGVGGASGTALAELYDATPGAAYTTATPRLVNVSLMKNVGAGTTLGFYIGGSSPVKVLLRAVGPTLGTTFGLSGVMADPKMTLIAQGSSTALDSNDDWGGTAELQAAFKSTSAFALPLTSKDAALLETLPPGGYSVQVSAASGATGTAIIEVYEVP